MYTLDEVTMYEQEKPLIVTQIAPCMFEIVGSAKDDFNIIQWSEIIDELGHYLPIIQGVIVSPLNVIHFTDEHLTKMTKLKVISSVGVGIDHLDLPLIRKYGIKVGNTPDVVTQSTADLAFTLMLTIGRRIPEMMEAARGYKVGQKIDIERSYRCRGQDIFETTLGIVGMGSIGLEIATRAQGFRMKILYHNRTQRSKEDEASVHATYVPTLEELLPQADYLILCTPLTSGTRHMIQMEQLKLMKSTSFLINIARGGLVKTADLVEALRKGTISGAALDATAEPGSLPHDHPLLHMPNVIVTPHAGVFTEGGLHRIYDLAIRNLRAALEGTPMPAEVKE